MEKIHIDLRETKDTIYFTSDLHLGHRNVITFCQRPFANTKEMEDALVTNWNNVVSDNDIVFILGDLFWSNDSRMIKKTLSKFKGKQIYIIPGNHDDMSAYHRVTDERIKIVNDICHIWITDKNLGIKEVILCHYPLMTWAHRTNGALQLFGHIHSGPTHIGEVDQDLPLFSHQQYDVGVDNNNYCPISLEEIYKKLKDK